MLAIFQKICYLKLQFKIVNFFLRLSQYQDAVVRYYYGFS